MDYEELEKECDENKMYAKRTIDLWCDAKKWKYLADNSEDAVTKQKYTNVANTLYELFDKEVSSMTL